MRIHGSLTAAERGKDEGSGKLRGACGVALFRADQDAERHFRLFQTEAQILQDTRGGREHGGLVGGFKASRLHLPILKALGRKLKRIAGDLRAAASQHARTEKSCKQSFHKAS